MSKKVHEYLLKGNVNDPYINLCAAILAQAMNDLKEAVKHGDTRGALALKRWFLSDYGQALSFNQGQYLIERVLTPAERK